MNKKVFANDYIETNQNFVLDIYMTEKSNLTWLALLFLVPSEVTCT